MQIKFNKLKPSAKTEEQNPAPAQQSMAQNPQNPAPAQQSMAQNPQNPVPPQQGMAQNPQNAAPLQQGMAQNPVPPQQSMAQNPQAYQRYAQQQSASKMEELTNPMKAAPSAPSAVQAAVPAPAPAATPTPAPAAPAAAPVAAVASKSMGIKMEDILKQFLNKQIRIYMADHESVTGRLDIVEDGWVKVCNARSAGSDYYFDEEIINTENIVRAHVSRVVAKEEYVDYMNALNNAKLK